MKKQKLRIEGAFPTDADLDWMEQAVQRHTHGFDAWWKPVPWEVIEYKRDQMRAGNFKVGWVDNLTRYPFYLAKKNLQLLEDLFECI